MTARESTAAPTRFRHLVGELVKFGLVGGVAFVAEIGVFNLLRYGPGGLLESQPLTAKVLAGFFAMVVAWLGNRHWTFSSKRSSSTARELWTYTLVNVAGIGAATGSLWFSHYVLGYTSALADNVAGNIIGIGLGTIVRYFGYKFLVFTGVAAADQRDEDALISAVDMFPPTEHAPDHSSH